MHVGIFKPRLLSWYQGLKNDKKRVGNLYEQLKTANANFSISLVKAKLV